MTDVEATVGLGWETGDDVGVFSALQIFIDDMSDEIGSRRGFLFRVTCLWGIYVFSSGHLVVRISRTVFDSPPLVYRLDLGKG